MHRPELPRRANHGSAIHDRRPKQRNRLRLPGLEQLEARAMLSAAPALLIGPLPPTWLPTASSPSPSAPVSPTATSPSPGSASDTSYTPPSAAQVTQETAIGAAINAFGLDLYSALQQQSGGSGNLVISPISVSAALAMAYAGANGDTATEMASVLHFAGDDAVEQEFGTLLSDLNSAGQGNYTLSLANSLWSQQGMQLLTPFLQTMQADFGGSVQQVDFQNNPTEAVQTINNWVSQETQGLIQNLLSPSDVSFFTKLMLVNAVYFQGNLATGFDPTLTQNAAFTLDSGDQVQVAMMHNTAGFGYMDSDGFQVLSLPYQGGRLSMDVILPIGSASAAGLNVSQLPADLSTWLSGLQTQQVAVSLPKFVINTQEKLTGPIESLGMSDAFSPTADFSGIAGQPLNLSTVVQQATIRVNETGTIAAAATGVGVAHVTCVVAAPQPVVFNADHPFLFLIRDNVSGSILFMGQEMDPTSTTGDSSAPPIGSAPSTGSTQPPLVTVTPPSPPSQPPTVVPVTLSPLPTAPTQNPTTTTNTPLGPMPWHPRTTSPTTGSTTSDPTSSDPTDPGPSTPGTATPGTNLSRPIGPLPLHPLN